MWKLPIRSNGGDAPLLAPSRVWPRRYLGRQRHHKPPSAPLTRTTPGEPPQPEDNDPIESDPERTQGSRSTPVGSRFGDGRGVSGLARGRRPFVGGGLVGSTEPRVGGTARCDTYSPPRSSERSPAPPQQPPLGSESQVCTRLSSSNQHLTRFGRGCVARCRWMCR
jgi:hypothetical protein